MSVYLISVGVSLMEEFADPHTNFADPVAIETVMPPELLRRTATDSGAASAQLTDWFGPAGLLPAALTAQIQKVQPRNWAAKVSPELLTFHRGGHGPPLPTADVAILLASDTIDGLTAAVWNALALVDGDPGRVVYQPVPGAPLPNVRGRAVIVRVPGMDAGSESGFRQAMRGLGALGRSLLAAVSVPTEDFLFYLSGGFKAGIPYLIGLAEGIRSLHPAVAAFVLHETSAGLPIGLPLRRIPIEGMRSELAGFNDNGESNTKPATPFLHGYAYDSDGATWRLTAFGEGLAALLDTSPLPTVGGP